MLWFETFCENLNWKYYPIKSPNYQQSYYCFKSAILIIELLLKMSETPGITMTGEFQNLIIDLVRIDTKSREQ